MFINSGIFLEICLLRFGTSENVSQRTILQSLFFFKKEVHIILYHDHVLSITEAFTITIFSTFEKKHFFPWNHPKMEPSLFLMLVHFFAVLFFLDMLPLMTMNQEKFYGVILSYKLFPNKGTLYTTFPFNVLNLMQGEWLTYLYQGWGKTENLYEFQKF